MNFTRKKLISQQTCSSDAQEAQPGANRKIVHSQLWQRNKSEHNII